MFGKSILSTICLLLIALPVLAEDKYYDYGMKLMDKKQLSDAIKYFDASISSKSSSSAQSWYRKADCLEQLEKTREAISAYEQVLRIAPKSLEAQYAKCRINVLNVLVKPKTGPPSCVILRAEKEGRKVPGLSSNSLACPPKAEQADKSVK